MDTNTDNLKRLIDLLKKMSFWERLFSWRKIKLLLVDAAADLQKFISGTDNWKEKYSELRNDNERLHSELSISKVNAAQQAREVEENRQAANGYNQKITELSAIISATEQIIENRKRNYYDLEKEHLNLKKDLQFAQQQIEELKRENTQFATDETNRKLEHEKKLATLANIQQEVKSSREKEIEDRHMGELQRLEKLKDTWSNHQQTVKQVIKSICSRHTIDYVEKVPFRGDPDNALNICNEYIIFDAKSPQGEDLGNFPKYLKAQAENARKYASIEDVKKWIFMVVPSNALDCIQTYVYHLADYEVFVISVDALEPVILSLKRIEDYDFAEQLSPEDRENICRIVGKFAHLTKRRIQIDTFFIKQFMELAYKAESDLPPDFLERVVEFEKAEKLNPPSERRKKHIDLKELEKDTTRLRSETIAKGISIVESVISTALNELPLYSDEASD
ncbi:MAG TPA: hypothetical protein VEV83_18760 [Parafilimonas sp.]|nr:hypothetical protein [Parafilimonas sp.]